MQSSVAAAGEVDVICVDEGEYEAQDWALWNTISNVTDMWEMIIYHDTLQNIRVKTHQFKSIASHICHTVIQSVR